MAKTFKQINVELTRKAQEIVRNTRMKDIGEEAARLVKNRTRQGFGVEIQEGDRFPLKKLSEVYKERRAKLGTLSENTKPGRSNLTQSGQLLDAMKPTVLGEGRVQVGPIGSRKNSILKNEEVATFVSKERPFNNLSKAEKRQLGNFIQDILKKLLGNFN